MNSICAACGKAGCGLKTCSACKSVKYCTIDCQRAHRKEHKKDCKRIEKELKAEKEASKKLDAMKLSVEDTTGDDTDSDLFNHPKRDECPICMITLPLDENEITYQGCCAKILCSACIQESIRVVEKKNMKRMLHPERNLPLLENCCPFCRKEGPKSPQEIVDILMRRVEMNDGEACYNLACAFKHGHYRLPPNEREAYELYQQAADLGQPEACNMVADQCLDMGLYSKGRFIKKDISKGMHYLKQAAKGGFSGARHNLGVLEAQAGNHAYARRHWMVSAAAGFAPSLDSIKLEFTEGRATKDEYAAALRAHQKAQDDEKNIERERARVATSTTKPASMRTKRM